MGLEIMDGDVRNRGETAGRARHEASIWTEQARRKNEGGETVTLEGVQAMKEDLDWIQNEIDVLLDRSKKLQVIIVNAQDKQEEEKYTREKMKLGVDLEKLDKKREALAKELKSAEEMLKLKAGGLPPLEFPHNDTKH